MLVRPGIQTQQVTRLTSCWSNPPVPNWAREAAAAVTKALGDRGPGIDWARSSFSRGHAESIDVQLVMRDGSRRALVVTDQFSDQLQVMTPRAYQSRVGF